MSNASIPRPEYPRPQFVRHEWLNLNGVWEFEMDLGRSGLDATDGRVEEFPGAEHIRSTWCGGGLRTGGRSRPRSIKVGQPMSGIEVT